MRRAEFFRSDLSACFADQSFVLVLGERTQVRGGILDLQSKSFMV